VPDDDTIPDGSTWILPADPEAYGIPPAEQPRPAGPRERRRGLLNALGLVVAGSVAGAAVTGLAMRGPAVEPLASVAAPPSASQPAVPDAAPEPDDQGSATPPDGSATDSLAAGVVDIRTTVGGGEAAGTGMVLTADGEVITNNHVISGATSITVTDVSTGRSYDATVVGYDRAHDVAVLQVVDAGGLTTVNVSSDDAQPGDSVVAIGNAGGAGGSPEHATGTVTDTEQTITATDAGGGDAERLTGLIETNAAIVGGYSGGPLLDVDGEVVGMDTAASAANSRGSFGQTGDGYAIPIDDALSIVQRIVDGHASSTTHIGGTAVLGVSVGEQTGFGGDGVVIEDVVSGGGAEAAGLAAGDTITAVDGQSVSSVSNLRSLLNGHGPGDSVRVSYVDGSGRSRTTTVRLGEGPPL
jgi:S1-C subfamily serine protease